ncbi:MAG: flavohemoglobin expression-modulating QEGLA motif protein [Planctomycetota bacterium]
MIEKKANTEKIGRRKGEISPSLINTVCRRLARRERVRRTLPLHGRLHIDRQLPFLCVYRRPPMHGDAGTERLVHSEASYLIASGESGMHRSLSRLVRGVIETLSPEFGAFLVFEIWAAREGGEANDPAVPHVLPTFVIHAPAAARMSRTIETLERRLKRIKFFHQGVDVKVVRGGSTYPPNMHPLITTAEARNLTCSFVGLAVPPVYREPDSTEEFPLLARSLRRSLSLALRQTWFEFSRSCTTHRPPHYHALGRRAVVKAVWDIDRRLAHVSNQFDYLLQLTPVNTVEAWHQFQHDRFEHQPEFHYRMLPIDPSLLKRELYKIPTERVEDPALQRVFQEKQEELELQLTMLRDRETPRFLYESLQLFGAVRDTLFRMATDTLDKLPPGSEQDEERKFDAAEFAERAEAEFAWYRRVCPEFNARARVTSEVSGLIVSRGDLLITSDLTLVGSRVEAMLAHEVGTHVLTYQNGRMQPFQQLYSGLAGYEELQEGLAVLSEFLVGALSSNRLRQIAARVVAVRHVCDGATFIDTFRALERDYGFPHRAAYNIAMRVYRGGGFTKDAVYLRGLYAILEYVRKGGELDPLFVGKMALKHIPIIVELQHRQVLRPAPLTPRHLQDPTVRERLQMLRGTDVSLVDLVAPAPRR